MKRKSSNTKSGKIGRPAGFVRRDAIEAAMNLFWQNGFQEVTVKDLAKVMGITRSSFYNSFVSREAVFREAVQLYGTHVPDAPLASIRRGEPVMPVVISVLRELCRVRANDKKGRGCLVCNSISELAGSRNETGTLITDSVIKQTAVVERLLRQAVRQKEIPPIADTHGAARSFMAFLIGLNTLSKVERDEKILWAACKQFLGWLGVPEKELV